jgi:CRP/FNR family cyclic AMP-dependent transcriptional regulator
MTRNIPRRGMTAVPSFEACLYRRAKPTPRRYQPEETIFAQGEISADFLYIQTGAVKLSSRSKDGRNGVLAILRTGDFFGEACLAGQRVRAASAVALTQSVILGVGKDRMSRLLRTEPDLSDRFISALVARTIRREEELADQICASGEPRLACALWRLAYQEGRNTGGLIVPAISQQTLAEMIGTSRSRVNIFLAKFRRRGFINDTGGLRVNKSLRRVILKRPPSRLGETRPKRAVDRSPRGFRS